MFNLTESRRAYLYRLAVAVLALLSLYGLVGPDEVPAWTAAVMAVLGVGSSGLAAFNTQTDRQKAKRSEP